MVSDPPVAAEILAAFERAAREPDPIFGLSEGFALFLRSHGKGLLSEPGCREIARALIRARDAALPHLPATFGADRMRMGADAMGELLVAWATNRDDPRRDGDIVEVNHLSVRIVANDLDSICASIELARGSATRPPVPLAAQPSASTRMQ